MGSLYSKLNIIFTPGLFTARSPWCWPCVFDEGAAVGLQATRQRPALHLKGPRGCGWPRGQRINVSAGQAGSEVDRQPA